MATPPIEVRDYWRRWTEADGLAGVPPQRLPVGPPTMEGGGGQAFGLFRRVGLQVRCLERGESPKAYRWGEWRTVPVILEGVESPGGDSSTPGAPTT